MWSFLTQNEWGFFALTNQTLSKVLAQYEIKNVNVKKLQVETWPWFAEVCNSDIYASDWVDLWSMLIPAALKLYLHIEINHWPE